MKIKVLLGCLLTIVLPMKSAVAQCAMCRATVESTISDGRNDVGNGLNFGILYLFVFPYLLVSVGLFLWYRKAKENQLKRIELETQIRNLKQ